MTYPVSNVGGYITGLAKLHGVSYAKAPSDELAETITRLSDDEVKMDETELLLFALQRSGVITTRDAIALQLSYLRE